LSLSHKKLLPVKVIVFTNGREGRKGFLYTEKGGGKKIRHGRSNRHQFVRRKRGKKRSSPIAGFRKGEKVRLELEFLLNYRGEGGEEAVLNGVVLTSRRKKKKHSLSILLPPQVPYGQRKKEGDAVNPLPYREGKKKKRPGTSPTTPYTPTPTFYRGKKEKGGEPRRHLFEPELQKEKERERKAVKRPDVPSDSSPQ